MKNNVSLYDINAYAPGVKIDLKEYKPDLSKPFYFYLEIYVKYSGVGDTDDLFSVVIANPAGLTEYYQNEHTQKEVAFGDKIIIFKYNYSYEILHQFIENLVDMCNGRNVYESSILLQRFFVKVDFLRSFPNGDYYTLFNTIKRGKKS
ncbi:hypothetical protein IC235_06485 [Hymenobacter sp. BT664]|uniref:Uncharacterized protein n=1 Tax=Hymenobacter montanus TaxID=2771359 RepID=A0A927BBR7_9BACT|nr:Imm8 family immunity protein [Hymenobacter montanus]MBD2767536.1 hypothetical protein [Hymenobacter montanus]